MKAIIFIATAFVSVSTWAQSQPVAMGQCVGESSEESIKVTCPISRKGDSIKYLFSKRTFSNASSAAAFCATDKDMRGLDDGSYMLISYFLLAPSEELVTVLNKSVVSINGYENLLGWKTTPLAVAFALSIPGVPALIDVATPLDDHLGTSTYNLNKMVWTSDGGFSVGQSNLGVLKDLGYLESMPQLPAICASMNTAQLRKLMESANN